MVRFYLLGNKRQFFWRWGVWIVIFVLFLAGGLGLYRQEVKVFGVLTQAILLFLLLFFRQKLQLPKGFLLFVVSLILLGLNVIWSKERLATLDYVVMFSGGATFWFVFYNLGGKFNKTFKYFIVFLGLVFGVSFMLNLFVFPQIPVRPWTLYLPSTFSRNHNHLGDLWALVLIVAIHGLLKKPRRWHWALFIPGVYFLTISLSRSAYLALGVGVFYLFQKLGVAKKFRKLYFLLLAVAAGLFLYAGLFKSTLFSRPYFEQVIWGFTRWPWGVGVGNFGVISTNPQGPWWSGPGTGIISGFAHNLIFEMISGLGILGMVFLAWIVYVLVDLLKNSKKALFPAIFLAITANFMFDTTYYIPTMLWLWFASLGLAQASSVHRK